MHSQPCTWAFAASSGLISDHVQAGPCVTPGPDRLCSRCALCRIASFLSHLAHPHLSSWLPKVGLGLHPAGDIPSCDRSVELELWADVFPTPGGCGTPKPGWDMGPGHQGGSGKLLYPSSTGTPASTSTPHRYIYCFILTTRIRGKYC